MTPYSNKEVSGRLKALTKRNRVIQLVSLTFDEAYEESFYYALKYLDPHTTKLPCIMEIEHHFYLAWYTQRRWNRIISSECVIKLSFKPSNRTNNFLFSARKTSKIFAEPEQDEQESPNPQEQAGARVERQDGLSTETETRKN